MSWPRCRPSANPLLEESAGRVPAQHATHTTVSLGVLSWDTVENSSSLCKSPLGRFFVLWHSSQTTAVLATWHILSQKREHQDENTPHVMTIERTGESTRRRIRFPPASRPWSMSAAPCTGTLQVCHRRREHTTDPQRPLLALLTTCLIHARMSLLAALHSS
jgi:hypothetical protein